MNKKSFALLETSVKNYLEREKNYYSIFQKGTLSITFNSWIQLRGNQQLETTVHYTFPKNPFKMTYIQSLILVLLLTTNLYNSHTSVFLYANSLWDRLK